MCSEKPFIPSLTALQVSALSPVLNVVHLTHKVLTYIEYRAVSGVFRIDPTPPLHPASASSPRTKCGGGGYTLAGR